MFKKLREKNRVTKQYDLPLENCAEKVGIHDRWTFASGL